MKNVYNGRRLKIINTKEGSSGRHKHKNIVIPFPESLDLCFFFTPKTGKKKRIFLVHFAPSW